MFTKGFLTIDEVVMDLQYRGQDYSMTNYDYWFHLAIKAIENINIFNIQTWSVAYLQVGETNIIELPSDFIDYVQVGWVDQQGVFHSLSQDPNILPFPHETCGTDTSRTLRAENAVVSGLFALNGGPYVLYGGYLQTPYAAVGGFNAGYYNLDRQNNRLLVSGMAPGAAIVLQYKSSGVSLNNVTMIRRQMQQSVISWCMMTAQDFGVIESRTNWGNKHYGDVNELESLDYALTMDEFKDILYGTWKQTPKR